MTRAHTQGKGGLTGGGGVNSGHTTPPHGVCAACEGGPCPRHSNAPLCPDLPMKTPSRPLAAENQHPASNRSKNEDGLSGPTKHRSKTTGLALEQQIRVSRALKRTRKRDAKTQAVDSTHPLHQPSAAQSTGVHEPVLNAPLQFLPDCTRAPAP
eukprot:CAMPEP_0174378618 /NCGR_PEP_ID=MMETSP0811_2-20130205/122163_1 /TAXON_ID=73025 ORGANISM="Eutreptiella gymnastica-like, Strain CCMP1594" /NCGR_SAMPLE_ID=MMETSP0811_2 /ASSEMBLY_ACC=CAM_ASM_000667 /LENGTH=153 /DNA_ID=CAMNT_0015530881 /DNA_START=692 /DNA_END=1152 /DNA_ORIENTATION=-